MTDNEIAPFKPPSGWRRVISGLFGLILFGGGTYLLSLAVIGLGDCAAWRCRVHILTAAFGSALAFTGVLFAFAGLLPFGRYRRVLIGLAGGLLAGAVLGLAYAGPATVGLAVGVGIGSAACVSYLGYRIAR